MPLNKICIAKSVQKYKSPVETGLLANTGGRIRTLNLLIRSQVLYPVELRPHGLRLYTKHPARTRQVRPRRHLTRARPGQ
jgi:hypothetical protein